MPDTKTVKTTNKSGKEKIYSYPRAQINFALNNGEIEPAYEAWNYVRNTEELAKQFKIKEIKSLPAFAKTIFVNNVQAILDSKNKNKKKR